jgi:hypothetical protein
MYASELLVASLLCSVHAVYVCIRTVYLCISECMYVYAGTHHLYVCTASTSKGVHMHVSMQYLVHALTLFCYIYHLQCVALHMYA